MRVQGGGGGRGAARHSTGPTRRGSPSRTAGLTCHSRRGGCRGTYTGVGGTWLATTAVVAHGTRRCLHLLHHVAGRMMRPPPPPSVHRTNLPASNASGRHPAARAAASKSPTPTPTARIASPTRPLSPARAPNVRAALSPARAALTPSARPPRQPPPPPCAAAGGVRRGVKAAAVTDLRWLLRTAEQQWSDVWGCLSHCYSGGAVWGGGTRTGRRWRRRCRRGQGATWSSSVQGNLETLELSQP